MTEDYGTIVGAPLLASLAALVLGTGVLLLRGYWQGERRILGDPGTPSSESLVAGHPWTRQQLLLAILLLTSVFLAANHLLVRGAAIGRWDADGQFFPYYVLVADHARALRFVQWDPWSNGGLPALGDPQVGAFSPVTVLLGLITGGSSTGFRVYWLAVWWLGGLGVLLLGRHLEAPPWGACAVALGFLFCGVYTGNAEHTSWISAFSFLPLTIWRLDVALLSRRLRPAAEAGALWGLSALAGYPGVVLVTAGFAGLWGLGRWIVGAAPALRAPPDGVTAAPGGRSFGFTLAALAVLLLAGLLVLSPTYFTFFFEGAGVNPRVGTLSREVALSNGLEPGALATFASPYLAALKVARQFMDPGVPPGPLWPGTDLSMVSVYAGAVVPTLALFAVLVRPRDRWRWWLTGLGLLSVGCAVGEALPLRGWLYDWLYPTRFFRHASIFRLYFVFAISVLALIGTRDLAASFRRADRLPLRCLPIAAAVLAVCAALVTTPFLRDAWTEGMPAGAVLLGQLHFIWLWLGVLGVALLAWRAPPRWGARSVPILLVALAAGDALITNVLSIPSMIRIGEAAERWKELDGRHRSSRDLTANGWWRSRSACRTPPDDRCRRNDQLVTKVPVFDAYATEKNPYHVAMVHHSRLSDVATGADRIWFSTEVASVQPTDRAFLAFRRRTEELGAPPIVVHTAASLLARNRSGAFEDQGSAIERLPAARRLPARLIRYLPEELVFDIHPASRGWLLVTDRWARSWRAEVNGREATLYGGNFIFRAVAVPAGASRVRMVYQPAGLPWLAIVSWGTLAAIAIGAAAVGYRRRSRPASREAE